LLLKIVKDIALMLLIFALLFAALNVGAWFYMNNLGDSLQEWNKRIEIQSLSGQGMEMRKKVFDTTDTDYLRRLENQPLLRAHPVLQFTSGMSTEFYTVGLEGIRYQPDWTDEMVSTQLKAGNTAYVFGGSTTFGHGVEDGDTVVAKLGELNQEHIWLNFGVNSHDSIRETDKLLHLLRQGYRPDKVVFIDGLNDLTTFMASPYRTADKPRTQGYLIDRGKPALLFGTPSIQNMQLAQAYALPITHVYFHLTEKESTIEYGTLDANKEPVNYRNMAWHYKNSFQYGQPNTDKINAQWTAHYQQNIKFIEQLGETFGFTAHFVLQPVGYVDPDNPFLTARYADSLVWEMAEAFNSNAQMHINNGTLAMIDCMDTFQAIDSNYAYVDATHYSPQGNLKLAECILSGMAANDTASSKVQ